MRSIDSHAAATKHLPVNLIDVEAVLRVLQPLWTRKAESAGKLRDRLGGVIDYARVKGYRSGEHYGLEGQPVPPAADPTQAAARSFSRGTLCDMPEVMRMLAARGGMAARAVEFAILTIARETMTLQATWSEIHADL